MTCRKDFFYHHVKEVMNFIRIYRTIICKALYENVNQINYL